MFHRMIHGYQQKRNGRELLFHLDRKEKAYDNSRWKRQTDWPNFRLDQEGEKPRKEIAEK